MDSNPYAFNRDVSYPTCAGFPRNMTCKDILEAHIQVVIPEKVSDGQGDFTAEVEDIFDHYRLPHISSEKMLNRWHQSPMDFYQNQVNLAVWLATSGCGVSWRDHLDIDRPLARSVFRFHIYYQVRRILEDLQAPLPQDRAWSPFQKAHKWENEQCWCICTVKPLGKKKPWYEWKTAMGFSSSPGGKCNTLEFCYFLLGPFWLGYEPLGRRGGGPSSQGLLVFLVLLYWFGGLFHFARRLA